MWKSVSTLIKRSVYVFVIFIVHQIIDRIRSIVFFLAFLWLFKLLCVNIFVSFFFHLCLFDCLLTFKWVIYNVKRSLVYKAIFLVMRRKSCAKIREMKFGSNLRIFRIVYRSKIMFTDKWRCECQIHFPMKRVLVVKNNDGRK